MKTIIQLSLLFLFTACSKGLTDSEARAVLEKEYSESCKGFVSRYDDIVPRGRDRAVYYKAWEELEKQGLISVERVKNVGILHFTEKARSEYHADKATADLLTSEIVNINGISQTDNHATVSFEIQLVPTIFYDVRSRGCEEERSKIVERTVEMIRYDTGWRLKE